MIGRLWLAGCSSHIRITWTQVGRCWRKDTRSGDVWIGGRSDGSSERRGRQGSIALWDQRRAADEDGVHRSLQRRFLSADRDWGSNRVRTSRGTSDGGRTGGVPGVAEERRVAVDVAALLKFRCVLSLLVVVVVRVQDASWQEERVNVRRFVVLSLRVVSGLHPSLCWSRISCIWTAETKSAAEAHVASHFLSQRRQSNSSLSDDVTISSIEAHRFPLCNHGRRRETDSLSKAHH